MSRRAHAVVGASIAFWAGGVAFGATSEATLADAAMNRDMAAVRALIREGADPNSRGKYDTPALLWLVRVGDVETAKLLLDAGANPNTGSAQGVLPLQLAVANGDRAMTELLLTQGAAVDAVDPTGETALFTAAKIGDEAIAELLLAHGAQGDRKEPHYSQTPLHVAAREGSLGVTKLLIRHGADVNAQTLLGPEPRFRLPSENAGSKGVGIVRGGWPERGMRPPVPGAKTPLLYATRAGHRALALALLEAGAKLEQTDGNGVGPLLNTILNASVTGDRAGERLQLAHDLIDKGADVNAADWYGETPLWAAVDLRNVDLAGPATDNGIDRAAALALIEALLASGAEPNPRVREYPPERRYLMRLGSLSWVDFTGQTPFLRAALAGDTTVMKLLLAHGADPNIATYEGTTPLMAAAGVNWVVSQTFDEGQEALLEAVKLAHQLGNDVNAVNSMGIGAVHGAANRGSNDILRYLAEQGARLDVPDRQGRTPLAWAEGVFLATHPPVRKPSTIDLIQSLLPASAAAGL
jgi:ankyrin repeat protein